MGIMSSEWSGRLQHWMRTLKDDFYRPLGTISWEAFRTMEHLSPEEAMKGQFEPVEPGFTWGKTWEYCWFRGKVVLPAEAEGKRIVMDLRPDGESTLFVNGQEFGTYRASWVTQKHHFIEDNVLSTAAAAGTEYEILMETYAGHYYPESPNGGCATGPVLPGAYQDPLEEGKRRTLGVCTFGIWNEDAYQLWMDADTLKQVLDKLDPNSLRAAKIAEALETFTLAVDFEQDEAGRIASYRAGREALKPALEAKNGSTTPVFYAVGNAHIDLAWLWPMAETHRKTERTFAAQLRLLEEYPEYKYIQSQPAAYEMCRKYYPELFQRIKEAVKDGKWIAEGAMWVEPDTNMASGEALIRQLLYGKKYYKEEFGVDSQMLWLPDTFGYTAALPQILKSCGVKYLVTQKIFWSYNEGEQFPYHYFYWEGMDGSKITSFLPTSYTYRTDPSELIGVWENRSQKRDLDAFLLPFGYGDGGGGPARDYLEYAKREKDLEGCPKVKQENPITFFKDMEAEGGPKHTYTGELYFSAHRGTYTSQAMVKQNNRRCELSMRELELWSTLAALKGKAYPAEAVERLWKEVLLHQFHDILPGSSIKEVYEDSAAQYEEIFAADEEMMKTAKKSIREKLFRYRAEKNEEVCAVWNPLSFARTALIRNAEGSWQKITAGPSGVTVCRAVNSGEDNCFTELVMEENGRPVSFKTPYFTVRFDANAEITSLVDIREDRELIQKGRMGNRLTVYEDRPAEFDAWNIDEGYLEKSWDVIDVEEFKVLENGPETAALHVRRRFQDSMIEQTIRFYRHTARIDFQTRVDWQEHQQLLRVSFPVDILAHEADYEIQFGNVKRPTHKNTSWDRARFEVCAHKWADLSEPGYGVALMNDCKYGYDVHEGVMGLTLIKSGIFPNPDADQGQHEFTYALFPHQGDFRKGSVVREAYDLNCPMAWEKVQGIYEDSFSMLQIAEENVMADTVKAAEDGNGIIVRIYETWGMRTKVHVNFPLAPDAQVTVCDCMENFSGVENADMTRAQDGWSFTMKPYEIKTLRIVNEKK